MKRYLVLLLFVCLTLVGCGAKDNAVKGQADYKGIIAEIDTEGNGMLLDDPDKGPIWFSLPVREDFAIYEVGQEVVVWIDGGVKESSPAQAKALHIEILEEEDSSLHKFDLSNHAFPPNLGGFVDIDGTRYDMAKGGYEWTRKKQATQEVALTDAASPTQIAEIFEDIVVEANSNAKIVIEQNPSLSVYVWNAERKAVAVDEGQISLPTTSGRYIYEVVAQWTNGEVSFTFVVDVTE